LNRRGIRTPRCVGEWKAGKGQRQLPSLKPTHNPASAPMPLNNTDV
jgi:hypothetical protein